MREESAASSIATLVDLQASVRDRRALVTLEEYAILCRAFLGFLKADPPTRIVSPRQTNYFFYQYDAASAHRITRPLNSHLFFETPGEFDTAFERFVAFLDDLRARQNATAETTGGRAYIATGELNRVVYTLQQAIGCIGDALPDANQSRKRIGQLFENLIKLILQQVGLICEPRTVRLPIPGFPGYLMPYQLDVVFSRNKAVLASETEFIHTSEIVGSVKTTSKDRIDKIFLDKYLLTRFLGREIPVVAVFLHDVQRAVRGNSIFGVNSTFKTNHFLGYTVALHRLDGVYYVDPRPEMRENERLREQIHDFQKFLVSDLWMLSAPAASGT